jgi:hypothetical protein
MADVVCLRASSCSDAESARQRSVLAGHLECEQRAARRRFLTTLLALLSAPVWAMALWPRLLEGPDRRFLLVLFGFLLALCCWAVIEEWRANHRLRWLLERASEGPDRPGLGTLPELGSPVSDRAASPAAGHTRL